MGRKMETEKITPLPGVFEFLGYLKQDNNNILGFVTGAVEEIAEKLLQNSGLKSYFSIFSFDQGTTRNDVLKKAVSQAREKYKINKVVVIGDTVDDIHSGKSVNGFTVGVATGSCSLEELTQAGADLVIPTMKEYGKILERV